MEINAVGGTFTLSTGGARTYALPHDASASAVAAALNALLGTGTVSVVELPANAFRAGRVYRVSGLGSFVLTVDDRNLDNPVRVAERRAGVNYYAVDVLNLDLGSGTDVLNVRGTTAVTNVFGHAGDERYYVSSLANENVVSSRTTDLLEGDLDDVRGNLNLDAGTGRHLLFISDEATVAGDAPVTVTDAPSTVTRLPGAEIELRGLSVGPITHQAAASGNFADGITMWAGYGDDVITIDGTHRRSGVRTITTLNTGLGDDRVTATLTKGQDDFFVLNAQGPYNQFLTLSDRDIVHAENSTLPLVIFGGQDDDELHGGTGGDIVFGDRGRVLYFDPARGAPGLGLTLEQLEAFATTVLGHGGPGDKTDGAVRSVSLFTSVDTTVGGTDVKTTGVGADVVIGGVDDDTITTKRVESAPLPDGNAIVFGDNRLVDYAVVDGNPASRDRIWTLDPDTGGM